MENTGNFVCLNTLIVEIYDIIAIFATTFPDLFLQKGASGYRLL